MDDNTFWNLYQQFNIWGLQYDLDRAKSAQLRQERSQDQRIEALEEEIEDMRSRMTVLVNFLLTKKVVDVQELSTVFAALDAKMKSKRCPRCGFTYGWDGARCRHCNYVDAIEES